jgi:hypothetical protein
MNGRMVGTVGGDATNPTALSKMEHSDADEKQQKMLRSLRKKAEEMGFDAANLDGWAAHVTGINQVQIARENN